MLYLRRTQSTVTVIDRVVPSDDTYNNTVKRIHFNETLAAS
jgi:hypothetical protein